MLEISFRTNCDAVEGLADINVHRLKEVGESKSFSWLVAQTKGEGCECKITKTMFFRSDLLKFCLNKNGRTLSSSLTQLFFSI